MMRIGQGYDIHPLEFGRPLWLGGVAIPYEAGLSGDSDADVLLHAIADALLGAAGAGDLGTWFPRAEVPPNYPSRALLQRVVDGIRHDGYRVVSVDATVLAEAPRLGPYREPMTTTLSDILRAPHVSVKFKTGDGLGPIGQRQAMAALAVVLLEGPEPSPEPE